MLFLTKQSLKNHIGAVMKEHQKADLSVQNTQLQKDKEIAKLIGNEIVHHRQLNNLTQKDLSNLLNLSIQQIQKYEYGETNISIYRLIEIADVLNTSVLNLLTPALCVYYQNHEAAQYVLTDPVEIEIGTKVTKLTTCKKRALLTLLID